MHIPHPSDLLMPPAPPASAPSITKKIYNFSMAPIRSTIAADPLLSWAQNGHWENHRKRTKQGIHELYKEDRLAQRLGVKESDVVKIVEVAEVVVAIYFAWEFAGSAGGSGAGAAGAGGTSATAAAGGGVTLAGAVEAAGTLKGASDAVKQSKQTKQNEIAQKQADEENAKRAAEADAANAMHKKQIAKNVAIGGSIFATVAGLGFLILK